MANRNQGFTLIELIVTLTVLAISIAVAVPAFTATLDSVRERALLDQLLGDIHFARSTAINRRRPVSICTGDRTCSGETNWSGPVFIFDDLNGNGALDDGDSPLRASMIGSNYQWSWSNFRKQPHLTFKPDGTTHSLNGSFVLCRRGLALKKVVINITGRVKLESLKATDRCG